MAPAFPGFLLYRCPGEDLWHSYRRFHSGPGMSGTDQCYFYRWRNGSAWGLIPVAAICNVDPVETGKEKYAAGIYWPDMHFSGGVSCVVRFRLCKQAVGRDSV